ncbi:uncharacterized protein LOC144714611 [Wolffia australiana]
MANTGNANLRVVKCPRCLRLLPEPPNLQIYKCGGCETILTAKNKRQENHQQTSDNAASSSQERDDQSANEEHEIPKISKGKSHRKQSWASSTTDDDFHSARFSLSSLSISKNSTFLPYPSKNSIKTTQPRSRISEELEEISRSSLDFSSWGGSSEGSSQLGKRSQPSKRHCRPIMGGSPFVICHHCRQLLHLPADFLASSGRSHKLKCGSCFKILVFSFSATQNQRPFNNPLHRLMGYPSARDILSRPDPASLVKKWEGAMRRDGDGGRSDGQNAGDGARRGAEAKGAAEIGSGEDGEAVNGEGSDLGRGRQRDGR